MPSRDPKEALEKYKGKRNFSQTREPGPTTVPGAFANLRFVVQKHDARRLHYDFRLEIDGVLKSWAVPNGPSTNPEDKRLAVQVEDHPLEYATFEGVIGHGNYGSGEVIVWDYGTFSPDEGVKFSWGDPEEAQERLRKEMEKGKISITLRGSKLKGSWTLVRTARSPKDWLLIKHKDAYVSTRDILEENASIQSGLTIDDLKSGRMPSSPTVFVKSDIGKPASFPTKVSPMLASLSEKPFDGADWIFEPKLDGYRVVAYKNKDGVKLLSRNAKSMTPDLPQIASALEKQPTPEFVLDGEIVVLKENGLPDFGLLQKYFSDTAKKSKDAIASSLAYYVFDILHLNGKDLTGLPLIQRKQLLEVTVVPDSLIVPVQWTPRNGTTFYQAATGLGLEGMIAKRMTSVYQLGSRSKDWLKVKQTTSQEFVIGGYSEGTGNRASSMGALLVGYNNGGPLLKFAARVGTGFDDYMLKDLLAKMDPLFTTKCPFEKDPMMAETKNHWVKPELIAEVKFAEWTSDGHLRAPVFLGLRTDKKVSEITLVQPGNTPEVVSDKKDSKDKQDSDVTSILDQLSAKQEQMIGQIGAYRVSFTNLNKELWPATKAARAVTKRDMIRYYAQMSPVLLPHLKDRPMTLTRYPNGINEKNFYQKHYEQDLPEFVETVDLYSSHNEGDGRYIKVNNLATLLWLAQLANIELHPWNSRTVNEPEGLDLGTKFSGSIENIDASALNYPDFIVFDLDPYIYSGDEKAGAEPEFNTKAFKKGVEIAGLLKQALDQLSLSSYVKTSGKTGLHIYVPIVRQYDYDKVREVCQIISKFVLQQAPNDVTMEWSTNKRTGKIFMDHNQNARGKNMASIYSLRPLPGAPVSTPVTWEELGTILPPQFDIDTVPERVKKMGDLWKDILQNKHDLSRVLGK